MTKGRPFSIYCIILFLCTEARKNNHILLQRGMCLSQKWSTAPFLPAGTQGGEALRVMRIVWHRRTCIRNLQSLHRRCPIWEPATHSHNGERNESACSSHFVGNCKKPQPMGNWLRGNGKHSENSRKKLKIPLKNCKTGRQGRENAHQAAQQKSPTDLKWLDISIKRTWKIGHRLRWFCAIQQKKRLWHSLCHRLLVRLKGFEPPAPGVGELRRSA